ncbi:thioredoxin [Comamonadaceae bacterium OH2545_COT-014]|nr:thioredoxin [Comamonadaceae bacterium OH2545_COT-014]
MPYTDTFIPETHSRAEVDAMRGPLVLEFGANWCGHCQRAQPLVREAFSAHPDVPHIKVEDGPGRPLGRSYKVKLWPTLIFLKDGAEQVRLVRPDSAQALAEALAAISG